MRVSLLHADWLRPGTWRMFVITSMVLLALALILWRVSLPSAHAADQSSVASSLASDSILKSGIAAAGAVEDTLKTCLARIPKDSSAGQRMIAEQACQRDERDRTLAQANPYHVPAP